MSDDKRDERQKYKDEENRRALMRAAAKGSVAIFEQLYCYWEDDMKSQAKEAQSIAIENGQLEFFKHIVKKHCNPRRSSLKIAAMHGQLEIVKYLIENFKTKFDEYDARHAVSVATECENRDIATYIKCQYNI
jgi:ankyrin repeat protein